MLLNKKFAHNNDFFDLVEQGSYVHIHENWSLKLETEANKILGRFHLTPISEHLDKVAPLCVQPLLNFILTEAAPTIGYTKECSLW